MMKKSLLWTILLAIPLSGCLGDGLKEDGGDVDLLLADVTTGDAPLNVTFTLDHAKPEANWSFELGDGTSMNGTQLPKTVEHVYETPGDYQAVFSIDGSDLSANVTIEVTGSQILQEYMGGWGVSTPVYCAIAGPVRNEISGLLTDSTGVPSETIGEEFEAVFSGTAEDGVLEYWVSFVDTANGFEIVETFTGAPGEPIKGTVPQNADEVHFSGCGASGPVELTYVVD